MRARKAPKDLALALARGAAVAVAMAMAMCEWRWPRGESGRTRQRTPVRAAEQPAGA